MESEGRSREFPESSVRNDSSTTNECASDRSVSQNSSRSVPGSKLDTLQHLLTIAWNTGKVQPKAVCSPPNGILGAPSQNQISVCDSIEAYSRKQRFKRLPGGRRCRCSRATKTYKICDGQVIGMTRGSGTNSVARRRLRRRLASDGVAEMKMGLKLPMSRWDKRKLAPFLWTRWGRKIRNIGVRFVDEESLLFFFFFSLCIYVYAFVIR